MSDKLLHDATASIEGTIYQFYVAVDKCFALLEGEKLIIEQYGDITISGQSQIEVKHYQENLTDLHENIWKTINNWLQPNFDVSMYNNLILLTTQNIGAKSSLKDWNTKLFNEKKQVLEAIAAKFHTQAKKSESTEKLLGSVLNPSNQSKLLSILDKFIILDSSAEDQQYYNEMKQKHGKAVLPQNRDDFINSLLGFILSPEIKNNDSWEISYDSFTAKVGSLVDQFKSGTIIFPKKAVPKINEDEFAEYLFVKKIEEIHHYDVKSEAISDYVRTNTTISKELSEYAISKDVYEHYEEELTRSYLAEYRNACIDTSQEKQIKDSKKFYNKITSSPAPSFIHYNDTPMYFRNGILHQMANDSSQNIIWKLKVDNE